MVAKVTGNLQQIRLTSQDTSKQLVDYFCTRIYNWISCFFVTSQLVNDEVAKDVALAQEKKCSHCRSAFPLLRRLHAHPPTHTCTHTHARACACTKAASSPMHGEWWRSAHAAHEKLQAQLKKAEADAHRSIGIRRQKS